MLHGVMCDAYSSELFAFRFQLLQFRPQLLLFRPQLRLSLLALCKLGGVFLLLLLEMLLLEFLELLLHLLHLGGDARRHVLATGTKATNANR